MISGDGISPVFREYLDKYSKYIAKKFKLNQKDFVMEIGSNDGTLLQSFKKNIGCKILGIDPSKEPSKIAKKNNINVINSFFSFELAKKIKEKYNSPKLITTHNTFAHVENIHDFFKGIEYLRFLLFGLKFLHILYNAFSAAFLNTLKPICLLDILKP